MTNSTFNRFQLTIKRKQKKLSQEELAQQIGMSETAISNLETGKSSPTADTLKKIGNVLDCPMDVFFEQDINCNS